MSLHQTIFNECYKYIVNNGGIPYIYVNTHLMLQQELQPYTDANRHITLNISMTAVEHFKIDTDGIKLSLKFKGQYVHTHIPYIAIKGIYNKNDTTTGMLFNNAFLWTNVLPPLVTPPTITPTRKKPSLTIVK